MNHHLAIIGGDWSSASGDIKYLICHVSLQNYVINVSSNFMSGSFMVCYQLAKFGIVVVRT